MPTSANDPIPDDSPRFRVDAARSWAHRPTKSPLFLQPKPPTCPAACPNDGALPEIPEKSTRRSAGTFTSRGRRRNGPPAAARPIRARSQYDYNVKTIQRICRGCTYFAIFRPRSLGIRNDHALLPNRRAAQSSPPSGGELRPEGVRRGSPTTATRGGEAAEGPCPGWPPGRCLPAPARVPSPPRPRSRPGESHRNSPTRH